MNNPMPAKSGGFEMDSLSLLSRDRWHYVPRNSDRLPLNECYSMFRFRLTLLLGVVACAAVSLAVVRWLVDEMDFSLPIAFVTVLPVAFGVSVGMLLADRGRISSWLSGTFCGASLSALWPGLLVLLNSAPEKYESILSS